MRSREGQKRECVFCEEPTVFVARRSEVDLPGSGFVPVCPSCGERPGRRRLLAGKASV